MILKFYLKTDNNYWDLGFKLYYDNLINYIGKICDIVSIDNLNSIKSNDIIICFTKDLYDLKEKKNKLILVQVEPLLENHFHQYIDYINNNKNIIFILDYTYKNINLLKNHKIFYLPIFYYNIHNNLIKHSSNKKIDILFYGGMNKMRKKLFRKLRRKMRNKTIVWGCWERDILIRKIGRSKIVLTSLQEDFDGPGDPFRTCFLYSNKCFVMQCIQDKDLQKLIFDDELIYSNFENLDKHCTKYLNLTQEERNVISEKNYNTVKEKYTLKNLIPSNKLKEIIIDSQTMIDRYL
jgi:hypothetical protein